MIVTNSVVAPNNKPSLHSNVVPLSVAGACTTVATDVNTPADSLTGVTMTESSKANGLETLQNVLLVPPKDQFMWPVSLTHVRDKTAPSHNEISEPCG